MNAAPHDPNTDSPSLALLTDLYQLTMAYGYWKLGRHDDQAAFSLFFRRNPFKGGYAVCAGLGYAIDYLSDLRFSDDDVAYLQTLTGNDDQPLFEQGFLDYLRALELTLDVCATPEGTVVFPHQPLLRVTGSILQCQILETALLNMINFQTLVATKAARICQAATGPVLEFGLRRAQGIDGALAASRAAYIGGCAATSNVLAARRFGIPVKGTHAHSWVMLFDTEPEAFDAYADAMPNNCVFLVDTYDTLQGVRNAIVAGRKLRDRGHEMVGIRLDSGDLAYLSIAARKLLDEAGFEKAAIVASNDLDEHVIESLKSQHAKIGVWGVGTRLATAYDEPALGGVYKLTAARDASGQWRHKIKLSEQTIKVTTPGVLQVRRFSEAGGFIGDMVYDELLGDPPDAPTIVNVTDPTQRKPIPAGADSEDLLVPIMRAGKIVYTAPPLSASRDRAQSQLAGLHEGIRRILNPHHYPAGLELGLHDLKTQLILTARGESKSS